MNATKLLALIVLIALIIFGPLAVIWALNTLFSLAIPYVIETWAAVVILCGIVYKD